MKLHASPKIHRHVRVIGVKQGCYVENANGKRVDNTDLNPQYHRFITSPGPVSAWIDLREPHYYLSHPWGGNFQHLLADLLPRLCDYDDSIPLLCQGPLQWKELRFFLDILGFKKVTWVQPGFGYRLPELIVPDFPGNNDVSITPPGMMLLDRIAQLVPFNPVGSKVYLSRLETKWDAWHKRIMLNESLITDLLVNDGYTVVIPNMLQLETQLQIIKGCDILLGSVGAGLMNVLWMRPNTKLICLGHPTYPSSFFKYLAAWRGVEYIQWNLGKMVKRMEYGPNNPWVVDAEALSKQLQSLRSPPNTQS